MITGDIIIEQKDLESVQELCSSIEDKELRNKVVANTLAVKTAAKYFDNEKFKVDDETGLYKLGSRVVDANIADLYINNCYLDVRLYFSPEEMGVPKTHFDNNINPVAYMFIKIDRDISKAQVTGFIRPENIDTSNIVEGFYPVQENSLDSVYDIESRLQDKLDIETLPDEDLYEFADGNLPKFETIARLVKSKSSRAKLHKIFKAQSVYNIISLNPQTHNTEDTTPVSEPTETEFDDIENLYDALSSTDETSENSGDGLNYRTEVTPSNDSFMEENASEEYNNDVQTNENSEQIDNLFSSEEQQPEVPEQTSKNRGMGFIAFIIIVAFICGGAFWAYKNFNGTLPNLTQSVANQEDIEEPEDISASEGDTDAQQTITEEPKEDAMPIETVENNASTTSKELGNSVAIPAIERNLDASVLVSNLKVDWEVPEGYISNTAARRYLIKLGKVIQLNLKTDLLLLSKPPISNKIAVEVTYNASAGRFTFVGFQASSGEKTVDDAIEETIKKVLETSMSTNTDSFTKLKGNPILVIHL